MRACPNCAYMLPDAADRCLRCHAPVSSAPAPVPVPVSAPGSAPGPAAPAAGFDPRYAAPARIGFGDPLPNPTVSPFERVPTPGSQWAPAETTRRKSPLRSLVRLLIVAAVVLFGFTGWKYVQVQRNQPPAATRAFVDGGGVQYAPPGLGFSVRLPSTPLESSETANIMGATVTAHGAMSAGEGYEIVVGVATIGGIPPEQLDEVLSRGISGFASTASGYVDAEEFIDHRGNRALVAKIDVGDDYPSRVMVIHNSGRLFVLAVHSKGGADVLLDELADSLVII